MYSILKNFVVVVVRVVKHWNRLLRELLESPSQNSTGHCPEQPTPVDSPLNEVCSTTQSAEVPSSLNSFVLL